jgi:hypothetical protein
MSVQFPSFSQFKISTPVESDSQIPLSVDSPKIISVISNTSTSPVALSPVALSPIALSTKVLRSKPETQLIQNLSISVEPVQSDIVINSQVSQILGINNPKIQSSKASKASKDSKVQCRFIKKNKEQCKLTVKDGSIYCWRHIDSNGSAENTPKVSTTSETVKSTKKGIVPVSVVSTGVGRLELNEFKFEAVILPKTESKDYNEDYKKVSKQFGPCITGPFKVYTNIGENISDSSEFLEYPIGYYSLEKVINEIKKYYNKNLSKKMILQLQKLDSSNTLYSDFLEDLKNEYKHKYNEANGSRITILGFEKISDSEYNLLLDS